MAATGFSLGEVAGDLDLLARRIDDTASDGCDAAEIGAVGLDAVVACRLVPARVARLRAILAARPMAYSLHAPIAVNLMDVAHAALQRRALLAALRLSAEIGADVCVVHPGACDPRAAQDEAGLLAAERDALADMAAHAAALGVRIAYETMNPNRRTIAGTETSYALDPARLAGQIEAVGRPDALIACLDVSHALQGATLLGIDLSAALRRIGPLVGHIHISDSTGAPATIVWTKDGERQVFGVGDMHAPPGWGAVDYEAVASALSGPSAIRPDTRVIIELKQTYHSHARAETLAGARAFAAALSAAQGRAGDAL